MKAKFSTSELLGVGLTLVVLGIGIAYGLEVLGDVRAESNIADCTDYAPATGYTTYVASTEMCYNGSHSLAPVSPQYNATVNAISGTAKLPEKLPTIATVVVASVIIGILVTYMWGRFR